MQEKKETVYSVSQITRLIKETLEKGFPGVWIEGEISNFKRASTGHVYFTLKDDVSQISVVMFRSYAVLFCKMDIMNGVRVRIFGDISVYEKGGNYQLICVRLEKAGLGELQLKFLQLKETLFKKGWFEPGRKKKIPFLPERIAIVTSKTGAAVRDMLNIIFNRFPNMSVVLFPVKVQGEGAAEEIASAIKKVNELKAASVMIVGRGGGSIEDLWAFNEFVVAEAIYRSAIPVITGIGHEIDFTIADFVSDKRAETPTAAAVLATPVRVDLFHELEESKNGLRKNVHDKIVQWKEKLRSMKEHYGFREPLNQIRQYYIRLDEITLTFGRTLSNWIHLRKQKIQGLTELLASLSPYSVLERGFTLTKDTKTNKMIHSFTEIKNEMELETLFKDGSVISRVISK
ncbi:MAG: exodeoxyribonuclease VII large subunit [Candidatus Aureabacteria bacterium]|nr:exodeoxyribonuclease VII large subunit [Candidatus Auribacterota bacterium]